MDADWAACARRAQRALEILCCSRVGGNRMPSVAIVAAHPDDEVVGAGSRLAVMRESVSIIHITDGSPRDPGDAHQAGCASQSEYAALRRQELACALAQAGISADRCFELGVVDQESSRQLEQIARRLAAVLQVVGPDLVMTHPYEGGHPDHDAAAFAVRCAWGLMRAAGCPPPAVAEFTSYHAGPGGMEVFEFLPGSWPVSTVTLTETERELKSRMTRCFASQQRVLQYFPIHVERFRPAPEYDFLLPPHPGALYYENFPWGMTGAEWRKLACQAAESLGVPACR